MSEVHEGAIESAAATRLMRIPVLDGWRAISILLVLGSHLIWLGPKSLQLNFAAGAAGMALFFTLSGFLITTFLANGMTVGRFIEKRLARILPLAWTAIAILILWHGATFASAARNLVFVANLPPAKFLPNGDHLWSLCVEMQFYAVAAVLALIGGRRGMLAIPILCVAVTVARVLAHQTISIVTWHRADEILAGGILALIYHHGRSAFLAKCSTFFAAVLLLICSHPASGPMQYFRPYAAAFLVGTTLVSPPPWLEELLSSGPMRYVANISYALYVIHWILAGTWLGSGEGIIKYLKRPLLLFATFALADLSTRYLEQPFLKLTHRSRTEPGA